MCPTGRFALQYHYIANSVPKIRFWGYWGWKNVIFSKKMTKKMKKSEIHDRFVRFRVRFMTTWWTENFECLMNNGHSQPYNPCNRVDNKKSTRLNRWHRFLSCIANTFNPCNHVDKKYTPRGSCTLFSVLCSLYSVLCTLDFVPLRSSEPQNFHR